MAGARRPLFLRRRAAGERVKKKKPRKKTHELLLTEAERHEVAIAVSMNAGVGKEKAAMILNGLLVRHMEWAG